MKFICSFLHSFIKMNISSLIWSFLSIWYRGLLSCIGFILNSFCYICLFDLFIFLILCMFIKKMFYLFYNYIFYRYLSYTPYYALNALHAFQKVMTLYIYKMLAFYCFFNVCLLHIDVYVKKSKLLFYIMHDD